MDENPLYKGRPLRAGETCDQTGRSWAGVPFELRQFISLAVSNKEIIVTSVSVAHDVLDKILSKNDLAVWRSRCPETSLIFDQRKNDNGGYCLPALKIKVGDNSSNVNNPFGSNKTF
jgi:hypothetical protein